jgi:hypothetical protein
MTAVTPMSDRLSEIRARLDKATPGPWEDYDPGDGTHRLYAPNEVKLLGPLGEGRVLRAADAELIAHAPEDIRWLAGEVDRLRVLLSERDQEIRVRDREYALLGQTALDLEAQS